MLLSISTFEGKNIPAIEITIRKIRTAIPNFFMSFITV
jgi:hypothetical protein